MNEYEEVFCDEHIRKVTEKERKEFNNASWWVHKLSRNQEFWTYQFEGRQDYNHNAEATLNALHEEIISFEYYVLSRYPNVKIDLLEKEYERICVLKGFSVNQCGTHKHFGDCHLYKSDFILSLYNRELNDYKRRLQKAILLIKYSATDRKFIKELLQ